jgi:GNAT superfamily N-acetyltransferase
MPTTVKAGRPAGASRLAEEHGAHRHGAEHRLLPSLRPFWGHHSRHRGFDIRPLRTPRQHGMAGMLVRRMCAWRSYGGETSRHLMDDPNRVSLAAWQYDEVVATLTVGRDTPAGLLADALFAAEMAALRRPQRIVCELSRLALDPDFNSRGLLVSLMHSAYRCAIEMVGASDVVIEVDARHATYYRRLLGWQQLGQPRRGARGETPVLLLHQDLARFAAAVTTGAPSSAEDV